MVASLIFSTAAPHLPLDGVIEQQSTVTGSMGGCEIKASCFLELTGGFDEMRPQT